MKAIVVGARSKDYTLDNGNSGTTGYISVLQPIDPKNGVGQQATELKCDVNLLKKVQELDVMYLIDTNRYGRVVDLDQL